jgi:hypothetical protein
VNKKLEDVIGEKRQLRIDLTAKEKECAGLQRQLQAAQKVHAETKAMQKEDLMLDGASPVAGRKANTGTDRQAMAQLAKTVKSLQVLTQD